MSLYNENKVLQGVIDSVISTYRNSSPAKWGRVDIGVKLRIDTVFSYLLTSLYTQLKGVLVDDEVISDFYSNLSAGVGIVPEGAALRNIMPNILITGTNGVLTPMSLGNSVSAGRPADDGYMFLQRCRGSTNFITSGRNAYEASIMSGYFLAMFNGPVITSLSALDTVVSQISFSSVSEEPVSTDIKKYNIVHTVSYDIASIAQYMEIDSAVFMRENIKKLTVRG